jgi:hypothetical protein
MVEDKVNLNIKMWFIMEERFGVKIKIDFFFTGVKGKYHK